MPLVLTRYLVRRFGLPLLGGLLFYGGLVLANELIRISRELFALGAPYHWLFPMLGGILPEVLGFVLPMAAVLGGLMGAQSLTTDSELVASQGLGSGSRPLLKAWGIIGGILVMVATFNAHWLVPAASRFQGQMKTRMVDEARAAFLRPGGPPRYPANGGGDRAIWMAQDGRVHVMERGPSGVQHLLAERIKILQSHDLEQKDSFTIQLENLKGALYLPMEARAVLMDQRTHEFTFKIHEPIDLGINSQLPYLSTSELFSHPEAEAKVELARRFTLPPAAAALLLIGIALGVGHPRFQKGGPILKSLGVILLYFLLIRIFENRLKNNDANALYVILSLPFLFWIWGLQTLRQRFRPRRPSLLERGWTFIRRRLKLRTPLFWAKVIQGPAPQEGPESGPQAPGPSRLGVLGAWSARLWFRNWGAVLGSLLVLDLLLEYSNLAEDLASHNHSVMLFLAYWAWNLPPFLVVVLPMTFLLGGTLALSECALSREWTALRAGGGSLLRWCRTGFPAWGATLAATLLLQVWIAPRAFERADALYRRILDRPPRSQQVKPWLHLGSTGVLWHLEGNERWGFPLQAPGNSAAILLHWRVGDSSTEGIPWGGLKLVEGPSAALLFPHASLRVSNTPEGTPTQDLLQWQRWAPDPERAVLLWERLLGWLAGPCLLFAMLASAFPRPREGRGKALASALAAGLAFFGLQALFVGAARAGQLPAPWGVASPLLLLLAFGMLRLRELRT